MELVKNTLLPKIDRSVHFIIYKKSNNRIASECTMQWTAQATKVALVTTTKLPGRR